MRSKKAGLPPGTLVHVGEKRTERTTISVTDYDSKVLREKASVEVDDLLSFKDAPSISWIDVVGLHQIEVIERMGSIFGIHPLVLEDIVNTEQRPKMEDFQDYVFILLKMLFIEEGGIRSEQVSLIVGDRFLFSFQEAEGDVFEPVRERIRRSKGRIRSEGADYLAYALLDAVVDNYFMVLEDLGEELEILEDEVAESPGKETSQAIHAMKREMILMRRSIWPLREVLGRLSRGETPLFKKSTAIYLRDVYDHTLQVMDIIEAFRDMISGMLEIYLSTLSNKMNEVMKVLTIIATIFIPLTLIAGIYGMNFDRMPELHWRFGYPAILLLMLAMASIMLLFFHRKGWI